MSTKIVFSLSHNDHLIWTAYREIDPSHAKLMSKDELDLLGAAAEKILSSVITGTTPEDRPLVEKKAKPRR